MNVNEMFEENFSKKKLANLGKIPQRRRNLSPYGTSNPKQIPRSENRLETLSSLKESPEQFKIQLSM